MSKWEGGKVVFTEEETKELEAIIEGWFVNPSEDWIDYKGLSYEALETRLSRGSFHEWSRIYCNAAEVIYAREEGRI